MTTFGHGIRIHDRYWTAAEILAKKLRSFDVSLDEDLVHFLEIWFDDAEHFVGYTSGSTGVPKKMTILKKHCVASAHSTLQYFGIKPHQTALLSMPAKYIAGRMMVVRAIVGELNLWTISVSSKPELPNKQIDFSAFTPHQMLNMIAAGQIPHAYPMQVILLGGAPVSKQLVNNLPSLDGSVFETYGMTETYSHVALKSIYPVSSAAFTAVPRVSFDQNQGCLVIHAPHIGQDFLRTNDLVDLHSAHQFTWLGRADFVVNSGGLKLFPEELEYRLAEDISNPFFFHGKSDEKLGQKLVLVIHRNSKAEIDNLHTALKRKFKKLEQPKEIIFVDQFLFTENGKLDRNATFSLSQNSI